MLRSVGSGEGCRLFAGFGFGTMSRLSHLEPEFRHLAARIGILHGHEARLLMGIPTAKALYKRIGQDLEYLFGKLSASFERGGGLSDLQAIALAEGHSFYVPQGDCVKFYVFGSFSGRPTAVSAVNPQAFPEVREIGKKSVIITPLLTRQLDAGGEGRYSRHGIMTVEKKGADAFEPTVHMELLRMVGDDAAAVLAKLGVVIPQEI
ncbi:MAG: hypothetical protein JW873_04985 [Candidatus Saganbacteria bacterium]|nr:hypothetical protein [Candidatus Saganbacteria bacterium]